MKMYVRELGFNVQDRKIKFNEVKCAFFEYVRLPLYICRCFGLLPISGLRQRHGEKTKYTWKSLYTVPCIVFVSLMTLKTAVQLWHTFFFDLNIFSFYSFSFCFVNLTSTAVLMKFSQQWNVMLEEIEAIEHSLPPLKNAETHIRKSNRLVKICFIFAALDAILHRTSAIVAAMKCMLQENDFGLFFSSYFLGVLGWYFKYIPFNTFNAITVEIATALIVFIWNFTDIFVIVISKYLVARFQDFNDIIMKKEKEVTKNGATNLPWADLKNYYTQLMRLVKIIDKNINSIVFMSFTNIMFFGELIYLTFAGDFGNGVPTFCNLFTEDYYILMTYLYLSVSHLLVRTVIMATTTAAIHELSRRPLLLLYTLPSEAYDFEMQSFVDQVYNSKVSLSGFELFHVTRESMSSVMATLLTYEVVLLQM